MKSEVAIVAAIIVVIIVLVAVFATYNSLYRNTAQQSSTSTIQTTTIMTNYSIAIGHSSSIGGSGNYLMTGSGYTLYTTNGTCSSSCLRLWPLFYVKNPVPQPPLNANNFSYGTYDGQSDTVYNGHVLYTFVSDGLPGQISGNGVNGFYILRLP